jgi:hypothetical protein
MATTTNYGWTTPDDTALVKDGAAAIRTLGSSVDTTTKNLNPETTLGDIAYRSSTANVKTRLGLGTAGQVLTVNSGANAPEWATPASGGMTLISTTSLTGASTTISSIPGTYNSLFLLIYGVTNATADSYFICKPNNSAGANVYQDGVSGVVESIYGNSYFNLGGTGFALSRTSADNCFGLTINNYASSTNYKVVQGNSLFVATGAARKAFSWGGGWADNTAITSLVLSNFGGNLSTGTALLYGVK